MGNTDRKYVKPLTDRHKKYLHYAAHGMSIKDIAAKMGLAYKSAHGLSEYIKDILTLSSRQELAEYARKHGYAQQEEQAI